MPATTAAEAIRTISDLDLRPFVALARSAGELDWVDVDMAVDEYRHFLFLVWVRPEKWGGPFVVPTRRADALWHQHILHTADYRAFCDALIGRYIDHHPGLEPGTQMYRESIAYSRKLTLKYGADGFAPNYLNARTGPRGGSGPSGPGSSCGGGCGGGGDVGGCGGGCGGS